MMTVGEFKEQLAEAKVPDGAELKLHMESGDYEPSRISYSPDEGTLTLCSADEPPRQYSYRISYEISRDGALAALGTRRASAASDDDVIFALDEWKDRILREAGIEGEKKATGSIEVRREESVPVLDPESGKYEFKDVEQRHFYRCEIAEVFRELDEELDVYVRVWKNGKIA